MPVHGEYLSDLVPTAKKMGLSGGAIFGIVVAVLLLLLFFFDPRKAKGYQVWTRGRLRRYQLLHPFMWLELIMDPQLL